MWLWWVFVSFGFLVVSVIPDCEVIVHEPWPTQYIFVPSDSRVRINCTSNPMTSFWLVVFAEDPYQNRFSDEADQNTLHDRGVYEIPSVNTPLTLGLLINDTARNNGTEILCTRRDQGVTVTVSTTIFVFQPVSFSLEVLEKKINAVNISWSHDSSVPVSDNFLLTVSNGQGSEVVTQTLSESHYYFNTSDNTSPCEVYTFSVSASYSFVGATYTGEGCAITGTKSMMLPSLPNITRLESSIKYVLKKTSLEFILVVSFQAASYCEQYPVLNYTLEVKGPCSDVLSQSVSPGVENVIHNLTENTIYSFRVLVSNSVGVVSTNERQIYTTDVQNVTVTLKKTMDAFVLQCVFITGSNAQGCMVVLVGEFDNITANLSKLEHITSNSKEFPIPHPLSCYHEIFAFDIESDGSVGTLAVPGVIISTNERVVTSCPSTTTPEEFNTVIIIVIESSVVAALFILISMTIICIVICCKIKRSKKRLMVVQPSNVYLDEPDTNCSELVHCTDEELEIQAAEILYDQPVKAQERCSGDGAEYEKTKHIKDLEDITAVEREMNTYAELAEENHHYHTLEPQRVPHGLEVDPDAPALPPPYRPPSPEPLPAYQEIGSLQVAKSDQERDTTNGEIVNDQYQSSQNQPPSDEAQVSSETLL